MEPYITHLPKTVWFFFSLAVMLPSTQWLHFIHNLLFFIAEKYFTAQTHQIFFFF